MSCKTVYLLPIILFIVVPISFLVIYTAAVLNDHVDPGFPYISETGASPPESCIFGQLLNIAAFLNAVCVYIKYLEVQSFFHSITPVKGISHTFNKVALTFGITSSVGLDLVANFQSSNVLVVHMLGAALCFVAGTIYFILQVWISYKIPRLVSKHLLVIRVFLVGICVLTTASTALLGLLAVIENKGSNNWGPDEEGWELHLASTISEWVLSITYCFLILTFVPEFSNLELEAPIIRFKNYDNSTRNSIQS